MEFTSRSAASRRTPTTALLRVMPLEPNARDGEWEQLWLAVLSVEWRSLVVVPADPGASSLAVGDALRQAAARYALRPVQLIDASRDQAGEVAGTISAMTSATAAEGQVIVAVASPLTCPAAVALARAADAALLVVPLGATHFDAARRTVDAIGRARFIGSVALRDGP